MLLIKMLAQLPARRPPGDTTPEVLPPIDARQLCDGFDLIDDAINYIERLDAIDDALAAPAFINAVGAP